MKLFKKKYREINITSSFWPIATFQNFTTDFQNFALKKLQVSDQIWNDPNWADFSIWIPRLFSIVMLRFIIAVYFHRLLLLFNVRIFVQTENIYNSLCGLIEPSLAIIITWKIKNFVKMINYYADPENIIKNSILQASKKAIKTQLKSLIQQQTRVNDSTTDPSFTL